MVDSWNAYAYRTSVLEALGKLEVRSSDIVIVLN